MYFIATIFIIFAFLYLYNISENDTYVIQIGSGGHGISSYKYLSQDGKDTEDYMKAKIFSKKEAFNTMHEINGLYAVKYSDAKSRYSTSLMNW